MTKLAPSTLALAALLLLGFAGSGSAEETTIGARFPGPKPGQGVDSAKSLSLGWDSPDKGFWISGEAPGPELDASGRIIAGSGTGTAGMRYKTFEGDGFSLTTIPTLQAEAAWDADGIRHSFGAALFEELTLLLPAGLQFRARTGIGDRTGLSAPGAPDGLVFHGEAGLSGSLSGTGVASTRFDLRLTSTSSLGRAGDKAGPHCELKLDLTRKGQAPLNITASCPGAPGEGWVTLHIGGRF
ncbi:hypothetical protein J8J14_01495 [Roseomonas sp. SSH11]|uniref:Uncharacterized protein n=1 Tax=Pararoseomonas baculiformis TaxID=2820812 RepID=A0ABS4AAX6_9PROT|nr:hypothetical protein [Pararoseomonas baculiformis]MBP0443439.1 hypothetical protein [Pararoseomonas baculiformis]